MNNTTPKGCNGLNAAIDAGYMQCLEYYQFSNDGDEGTGWMVTFSDILDSIEDAPVFDLNYCPFCGTRFRDGLPQCAGKIGRMAAEERDVIIPNAMKPLTGIQLPESP